MRSVTYESLRQSYYADYETNARKSLHRDKDGNPYLDKVARLDSFFTGYRASDIDADLIRNFIADQQKKGLATVLLTVRSRLSVGCSTLLWQTVCCATFRAARC